MSDRSPARCASVVALVAGVAMAATPVDERIDPWVLSHPPDGDVEFLLFLRQQADLRSASSLGSKEAKGAFVVARLTETARQTQGPLLVLLASLGVAHRPFWIANMILVRGTPDLARMLASHPDVAFVHANPRVKLPNPARNTDGLAAPRGVEWNIALVGAPTAWAAGFTGQGAVVGGQDTGYEWDHPALRPHYRGWDGTTAVHDYNWHDAIHSGGGVCGPDSLFPCDDWGHGTHTMGTMVGDDGGGNQIGMAPGAVWIGCRNMDVGVGTPATYSECFQWFLAPTDLNNQNPDPAKAPHAINNSWACPPSEGCTDPNVLRTIVENTRAAGIVVVASAGNSGPSCSTVMDPPAIYDASFSVGATDRFDNIASFSSRGPVTVDGSGRLKPDISAPGEDIRSSVPGGQYAGGWSGTSMAGPHVAGLVALHLSASPSLIGQVDQIEDVVRTTAMGLYTTESCGGPGNQVPNNTYGYGRIQTILSIPPRDDHLVGPGAGAANANRVRVFTPLGSPAGVDFLAYGAGTWGVRVAGGNVSAGANDSILTGPGPGPTLGPQARGFTRTGTAIAKINFYAYGTMRYGVNVSSGSVDADAFDEILTGPGPGSVFGPHVRGWNFDRTALSPISGLSFFAYGTLRYGVNVDRGDVDEDGTAEILTGAGPSPSFAPTVKAFDFTGTVAPIVGISFDAFPAVGYGVVVAGGSVDADARVEMAAAPGPGGTASFPSRFRGFDFDGSSVTSLPGFDVTAFPTVYGGRVGLGDLTGDGVEDLLTGAGPDPSADSTVNAYRYDGAGLPPLPGSFVAFTGLNYGVSAAGAALGF